MMVVAVCLLYQCAPAAPGNCTVEGSSCRFVVAVIAPVFYGSPVTHLEQRQIVLMSRLGQRDAHVQADALLGVTFLDFVDFSAGKGEGEGLLPGVW